MEGREKDTQTGQCVLSSEGDARRKPQSADKVTRIVNL